MMPSLPYIKNARICVLLLMFVLVFMSCTRASDNRAAVRLAVSKYSVAIISAYKDIDLGLLNEVATKEHKDKVSAVINAYMQANEVMEAELLHLDFVGVEIKGEEAEVRTTEDWSYRWVDYDTREIREPEKKLHYEMSYELLYSDGRWLVDEVKVLEEHEAAAKEEEEEG